MHHSYYSVSMHAVPYTTNETELDFLLSINYFN
jgi:hypothetical protein